MSRAATARWAAAHPDRRLESARKYRALHPDRVKTSKRMYREANREKERLAARAYKAKNKEALKLKRISKYASEKERFRERHLQRTYNLTMEQFGALFDQQGGRCAACGLPFTKTPNVDHDHLTGCVRGLLCYGCNTAAGSTKDSPVTLRNLADYLERSTRG